MTALSTEDLSKSFRRRGRLRAAVDALTLNVPDGGIHGLLGPNGSGKTTTIKMVLGLIPPDRGSVSVFGQDMRASRGTWLDRVGVVADQPRFVPAFSGVLNLSLLATARHVPQARAGECLEQVGLAEHRATAFGKYSLGMKQRLGIAAALLKKADLFILDEPSNGLDPVGVRDLRAMLRALAAEGKTILMSSHDLSEVEAVADTVSIMRDGRLVLSGTTDEIIARAGNTSVMIKTTDPVQVAQIVAQVKPGGVVSRSPSGVRLVGFTEAEVSEMNRRCAIDGIPIFEIAIRRPTLEDAFVDATDGD